jgi:hypothetical protein
MASKEQLNAELEEHINFIKTPAPAPTKFKTDEDCGVEVTNVSKFRCFRIISVAEQNHPPFGPF